MDWQPVRGDYRSTEVFGVSTRTLNEVVLRVCSVVITTMITNLCQQRTDDADEMFGGSQESEEDHEELQGSTRFGEPESGWNRTRTRGTEAVARTARPSTRSLFKTEKLNIRSVRDMNDADDSTAINSANGILRPYLYKKPADTSRADLGTERRGST